MASAGVIGQRRYVARQKIDGASQRFLALGLPPLTLPVFNPDKDYENMLQFEAMGEYLTALADQFAPLPEPENGEDTEPLEVGHVETTEPEPLEAVGDFEPLEPENGEDTIHLAPKVSHPKKKG